MARLLALLALPCFAAAAAPAGTYSGSKSVLGQQVTATIKVADSKHMSFVVGGVISLDCEGEEYAYDGASKITLTNAGTKGDCVHDALSQYKATLGGVAYDTSKDEITTTVKVGFMSVKITMSKTSKELGIEFVGASPAGTYHGTKTVFGSKVDATLLVTDSSHVAIKIAGPVSVDCEGEEYTYDGASKITLKNAGTAGDCVHDNLAKYFATIESVVYDGHDDDITISIKAMGINTNIELTKSGVHELERTKAAQRLRGGIEIPLVEVY